MLNLNVKSMSSFLIFTMCLIIIATHSGDYFKWAAFVKRTTNRWTEYIKMLVINGWKKSVLVIRYEDLQEDVTHEVN